MDRGRATYSHLIREEKIVARAASKNLLEDVSHFSIASRISGRYVEKS